MKNIIDYFNNNAFAASLITLFLSAVITIIINIVDKAIDRKNKNKDKKEIEYQNKGELRIERRKLKFNDQINVIYASYKTEDGGDKCVINKKLFNPSNLDYFYLPMQNLGKTAIRELHIAVNNREQTFIAKEETIKSIVDGQYVNHVVSYFNKLLPNEAIVICLNYLKKDKIAKIFSSELTIYYMDNFGNCYSQPLFLNNRKLEGPYIISHEEYIRKTSPNLD